MVFVALGGVFAVVCGIAWYATGGFPQDHDRYGSIPLGRVKPGEVPKALPTDVRGDVPARFRAAVRRVERLARTERTRVELPEGEVRLNWQGEITTFGNSWTVTDAPDDLIATVRSASGGRALQIENAHGYQSIVGDTGWESWRKVEIPRAGEYVVTAKVPLGQGGLLTIGEGFWNPFGSRLLGAFIPGLLIGLLGLGIASIVRAVRGGRGAAT